MNTLRAVFGVTLMLAGAAEAGRPLTVDDAGVDDNGTGHVEAWYSRQPGGGAVWTVAPAYAPLEGLELGAALARDRDNRQTSEQLQAKWLITPSREDGCNAAAAAGAGRIQGAGTSPFAYAILTCNSSWGSTHANLGGVRDPGGPTVGTWGIAHERPLGAVTVHAEAFGQRLAKPTYQVGIRTLLADKLQVDGTVGRTNRRTLMSVGVKIGF